MQNNNQGAVRGWRSGPVREEEAEASSLRVKVSGGMVVVPGQRKAVQNNQVDLGTLHKVLHFRDMFHHIHHIVLLNNQL